MRKPTDEENGRFGHLSVFDGGDGVGEAGPGRDGHGADGARHARHSVRSEDRRNLQCRE